MFSTCVHCHGSLDRNESIDHFPIGRRIAFDAERGRLWVVCRKCERWNLSPLETRWEAIEECARAFRETRVRVSTDNIGLARLREGTELVRIGAPLRPEFAAWRYGDQFERRQRRYAMYAIGTVAAVAGLVAGGVALGVTLGALPTAVQFSQLSRVVVAARTAQKGETWIPVGESKWVSPLSHIQPRIVARPDVPESWGIEIHGVVRSDPPPAHKQWPYRPMLHRQDFSNATMLKLRGNDAEHVMRWVLPRVNRAGASRSRIDQSVELIESAGDASRFGPWLASQLPVWRAKMRFVENNGLLHKIPPAARLAFEMSLHEETERRALEGELHVLEAAWRRADEIAKIADDMLVPAAVQSKLNSLREGNTESK